MNKTAFIKALGEELNYSPEQCTIINDVLENNFFISKKNQPKIISELAQRLEISPEEATKVYNVTVGIVNREVKQKLKHPFTF